MESPLMPAQVLPSVRTCGILPPAAYQSYNGIFLQIHPKVICNCLASPPDAEPLLVGVMIQVIGVPCCVTLREGKGKSRPPKKLIREQFLITCHGCGKGPTHQSHIGLHQRLLPSNTVPSSKTNNRFIEPLPSFTLVQFYHSSSKKGRVRFHVALYSVTFFPFNELSVILICSATFKDGFNDGHADKDTVVIFRS